MSKPATLDDVLDVCIEMEDKYSDLLWYVRKSIRNEELKVVRDQKRRIENKYTLDIIDLIDDADYEVGFSSGALAMCRLIITSIEQSLKDATYSYPDLDT